MATERGAEGGLILREGIPADAPGRAAMLQDWLDATPWLPKLHTLGETEVFMAKTLFPANSLLVAVAEGAVRGYLAVDENGRIASLMVAEAFRSSGIGSALVEETKRLRPQGLSLWTFVANDAARRFYDRHGFHEVRRTDGNNDEGLPDILMDWRPAS